MATTTRTAALGLILLVSCAAGKHGATPDGSAGLPVDPRCPGAAPAPDARCMQDCGSPAPQQAEPPPPFRWLSAEDARNRDTFGCPICLDATARIATPDGERPVATLRVGDRVWTEDADGRRIAAPLEHVVRVPVPESHRVIALHLADGRALLVSPGHPLAAGGTVGDLERATPLDGSVVEMTTRVAATTPFTFDLLPAGATGRYWANGVKLGSTLRPDPSPVIAPTLR